MENDANFKKHMDDMSTTTEINGLKVVKHYLGFGALPDIKLLMEDGSFLSAKKLFKEKGNLSND